MTPDKCAICQYQPCPPNRSVCYSCIPIDAVAERAQAKLDAASAERDRLALDLTACQQQRDLWARDALRLRDDLAAARSELRRIADSCHVCGKSGVIRLLGKTEDCPTCGPARRLLANHEGRTA